MTYTADRPCPGTLPDARVAPPDLLEVLGSIRVSLLAAQHAERPALAPLAARLQEVMEDAEAMPVAEDIECGYDGDLDDVHYHRLAQMVSWICPRCGHDNEEDAPGPDDPDRAYDEMRDDRDEGRL